MTADELRSWFDMPAVMLVAELPDGRIGGYADMVDHAEEHLRFPIDLRVPPGEHAAEIGAALVEAIEARAGDTAVEGATARLFVPSTYDLALRIAVERGYEPFRYSFQMRIEFDGELQAPEWPEGISVRTFVRGADDEAVYEAQNDAFSDHFEHARWPYESWRQWAFGESFDPSTWFVAVDGDEIAGVCLCRAEAGPGGEVGWVNALGVRPRWRRRGIASALLLHAFAEFRARGKRGAGLGVDGLNTTGAVALYEGVGMHVARRFDQYRKPLPA
jgi:mycothiol synthase